MGKTLATHLSDLRTDLKDAATTWSDAELTRCVARAYADLSRFLPVEMYYEKRLSFTVTAESFTSAGTHETAKALANKPIKYQSEVVTNAAGTVTYTRDTDYWIDYMNGAIYTISTGSMTVSTAYKISYTKSKVAVDMSSLAPMRIGRVEYPAHSVPQTIVSTELYGNILTVSCGDDTQEEMSLNKHVLVQYYVAHTVPTATAGTCPAFLDETVNLAAGAYALFLKAIQYELQSVTDLASARTALGNIAAIHVLIDTALDKVPTHETEAGTALAKVTTNNDLADTALDGVAAMLTSVVTELTKNDALHTSVGTDLTSAGTAFAAATTALGTLATPLTAIDTALAKISTWLTGASESTGARLALITTDVANLRTAIVAAVDAAKTALGLVTSTDFIDAASEWTDEASVLTTLAGYLTTGSPFINAVNIGADVASLYAQYLSAHVNIQKAWAQKRADLITIGNARTQQAAVFLQEAQVRLANLSTYIDQAKAYGIISDGFATEAAQWVAKINQIIGQANQDIGIGNGYISVAGMRLYEMDRYLAEADKYIDSSTAQLNTAQGWMGISDRYIAEAAQRTAMGQGFSQEASMRIAEIDRYTEEATKYTDAANICLLLADKFRTDAIERRNEAWSIWGDKKQLTGKLADISNRQVIR